MPLRPGEIPHSFRASESARGAVLLLFVIRPLPAATAPDVDALPDHLAERSGPLGHDGHLRSGGDVNDVVPADDREVHLALGLVVLRLLRGAEDEVHVGVESFEDSAVPTPAFQLN